MYKIKLPVFEGPFDLLLYLIKKNEIDIYDIPIAQITDEYLAYVELMQMLDLEIAGEFIEMVATLILIKTRTLLPSNEDETLLEVEDPRLQLTMQLLEYKRFKDVAGKLYDRETDRRRYFPRRTDAPKEYANLPVEEEEFKIDASLFDLLTAFKHAMDNMPKITVHEVKTVKLSIEDQVAIIVFALEENTYVMFSDLVSGYPDKIYVIVTFMAILDLMRLQLITVKQTGNFEDIRLVPVGDLTMSRYRNLRTGEELHSEEASGEDENVPAEPAG